MAGIEAIKHNVPLLSGRLGCNVAKCVDDTDGRKGRVAGVIDVLREDGVEGVLPAVDIIDVDILRIMLRAKESIDCEREARCGSCARNVSSVFAPVDIKLKTPLTAVTAEPTAHCTIDQESS